MCAIAGIVGLPYDNRIVNAMLKTMERRGPDGNGRFLSEGCGLLHTRLAIIDPLGGSQPMQLQWGDEEYVIIYNGELYNTEDLRSLLCSFGHCFSSHSDTEVLLHAYAQWGEEALQKLNGIYAFAIWEKHRQRLFLARDRMGVKPLFYKLHDGGILFASEMKTMLTYPTVHAELDIDGIGELLLLGPGRTPGSGVFHGFCELEPGCCGYFCRGSWEWKRYWHLKDREHTQTFEETAETVRDLVIDAIKRQMVSDVPIGTFLSGGLDSSLISSVCANAQRDKLLTFSVDYQNNEKFFQPGKFQPDSDHDYIPIVQKFLNTDHHRTVLTPENMLEVLDAATEARDLPGMADVDFSLLAFCKEIRKYVKVALSGECADEIFGGYPWYRDPQVRNRVGFPWAQNTRERASFLHPEILERLNTQDFVMSRYCRTVSGSDVLPGVNAEERRMKEMVNLNIRWFMQTLLDRKDRMSMYCSLEVRVPFCDHRIAEYMYGVPWEYKDYQGREKGLLRYAMKGVLPDKVLYRKKSPYPKTHDPHYAALVQRMLVEVINTKDAPIFQIIPKEKLKKLLQMEFTWPWYGQLMKGPQTIAYMLQINRWMERYKVSLI